MPFDLEIWKENITKHLPGWTDRMKNAGVNSIYAALSAAALLPVAEAYQRDPLTAGWALGGVVAGLGVNLLANQIQGWKDETEAAKTIEAEVEANQELRAVFDGILRKLDVLALAERDLAEKERLWYTQTLQGELTRLGSSLVVNIQVGDGAVAIGEHAKAVGAGGTLIEKLFIGPQSTDKGDLRRRYLLHVSQQANLLPWMQLTTDLANPEQGASLRLADVYIDLDTTELEPKHLEHEEELRQYLSGKTKRISAQDILNQRRTLLMMGDPGSGKSTFVKYLAYWMAQASLAVDPAPVLSSLSGWEHGVLFPLRVELRYLAKYALDHPKLSGAKLLLNFIHQDLADWELEVCWPIVEQALRSPDGGTLALLDGLDEVPTSQRQLVVDVVNEMQGMYPAHHYLVTCRPYAYVGQPWRLQGFHEVTLAPFNEEQIDRFIDNWYERLAELKRLESRVQGVQKAGSLKSAVKRRDLLGLAERPLLLTVMAQLHAYAGQLPEDRTTLYANAVELLLQRWEGRFEGGDGLLKYLDVPGLKMSDLEEGLYSVAFKAHSSSASLEEMADIREGDLCQWLKPYLGKSLDKAERFVEYIRERAGLLIRYKTEAYTFPHRSFQEFLAACHWLTFTDYPEKSVELLSKDWDRWREVFILAAGHAARTKHLGQAVAAVNALLPCSPAEVASPDPNDFRASFLAAAALLEIGLVGVERSRAGQTVLARTRTWLELGLRSDGLLEAPIRAEAGNALAKLGDPRFDPLHWYLPDEPLLGFVQIPEGPFWMGSDPQKDKNASSYEKPASQISLPTFYLGRYPVTVAQWREFVDSSGHTPENPNSLKDLPNHPVRYVTWHEALAYSGWLEAQLKAYARSQCGKGANPDPIWQGLDNGRLRVTLPSEAEWEKAARGTDGRIYPWGNTPDPNRANYDGTKIGSTSTVGCFPGGASPYGLQDMSGNVWEWTRSLWGKDIQKPEFTYPYNPQDGREKLKAPDKIQRVLRGGSFYISEGDARCAYRHWLFPLGWYFNNGFRVVVSPLSLASGHSGTLGL